MTTIIKRDTSTTIKVKVFYTLRGSKSTRLTTFSTTINNTNDDLSLIPIPLKTCLWSICSSSPDMICRDHDLSIYTANFHELGHGPSEKRDSLIWEGHGSLSWIMELPARDDVHIYGKPIDANTIDVYMELQPTLKWSKEEYFLALRNQSFEQFKSSTQSPLHPICNCFHTDDSSHHLKRIESSPTLYKSNTNETEFDRYLRHRGQQQQEHHASPPLPSRLTANTTVFRPEPIFPTSSSTSSTSNNNNTNNNNNNTNTNNSSSDYAKRSRLSSPTTYYKDEQHSNDLTLPIPSSMSFKKQDNRRSAFTIAALSDSNNKDHRYLPPSTSNSSTSSSASPPLTAYSKLDDNSNIPVIYTPSNKKRKKNPILMPASTSSEQPPPPPQQHTMGHHASVSSSSSNNNNNRPNSSNTNGNNLYQQQQKSNNMQQQQQVNTVVRTYYEVDRDNQGAYILPVEIDSWTVVDLGTVIYERPAYHNQRYIYPANYTVRKWYRSMVDPKSDTQYTCRILENGREPKFEVTADDCPMTYSGPTPTTVWTIIVRRAFAIRNQEYGHNPVGPDFFGLRKNTIAKMIQDLPNASKCSQYVWQTFEPARFNKPGRNRRRADSTLPGSLLGGVNYGLTSSRLIHNTNLTSTQHSYRANSTTSSPVQQQQKSFIHSTPSSPTHEDNNNNSNSIESSSTPTMAATT